MADEISTSEVLNKPSQTVLSLPAQDGSVVGNATVGQKLEETNMLLRAMLIVLCNMNDIEFTSILNLAAMQGSAMNLQG